MYRNLKAASIVETTRILCKRVEERFSDRGICGVCGELYVIAQETQERAEVIARPYWGLRILVTSLVGLMVVVFISAVMNLNFADESFGLADFLQVLEAGINDIVLLGAGIFFLVTIESRIKRERVLRALHELRSLAHVIDMHQLTKDPERTLATWSSTPSSPEQTMTNFELERYLDYCSEMLSLIGKIAALYIQSFEDTVVLATVNEIEALTTGLSRKIWQKIMIISAMNVNAAAAPTLLPAAFLDADEQQL